MLWCKSRQKMSQQRLKRISIGLVMEYEGEFSSCVGDKNICHDGIRSIQKR